MNNKLKKTIEYGLYLIVFLLPWQTRLMFKIGELNEGFWEYGTLSLYVFDFVVILTVILDLDYFIKYCFDKFKIKNNKWLIFLLLFLFWSGISIFWSADPGLTFYYFLRLFLAIGLAFVVATVRFDFKKLALSFVAAGVIQSILGLWQFLFQNVFAGKWLGISCQSAGRLGASVIELADTRWLRAYGSFPHPNILAGFLVISILLAIYLAQQDRKEGKQNVIASPDGAERNRGVAIPKFIALISGLPRRSLRSFLAMTQRKRFVIQNKYFLYILPLLTLALLVTFSRAAIGALIIVLLIYLIFDYQRRHLEVSPSKGKVSRLGKRHTDVSPLRRNKSVKNLNKTILIALGILIIFGCVLYPFVFARISGQARTEIISASERATQLDHARDFIASSPLLGKGLGAYTSALYQKLPQFGHWFYQPVHNIYILIWTELGLIGFVLFFLVLSNWMWELSKDKITQEKLVFLCLFIALLIIGLFDHYLWTLNCGMVLWWIVIGLNVRSG